jgi:hypothetical protein
VRSFLTPFSQAIDQNAGRKCSLDRSSIKQEALSPMKKLSTIIAAGTVALTLSTPVLAGSVGIPRDSATVQPDVQTIAELQQASEAAQREAREGNKDNPTFAQKSYEIDQLVQRIKSGEQVSQNQVDEALQPVWIW